MIQITDRFWAIWRLLSFVAIVVLAAAGLNEVSNRQDAIRTAAITNCKDANVRLTVIREVLLRAISDPPPESYAWITDPTLRQGAITSGNESRARMRNDISSNLVSRDCEKEFQE